MKNEEQLIKFKYNYKLNKKEEENNINEITIIYDYNNSRKFYLEEKIPNIGETISREKLFGETFVKNNKNICRIIINGEQGKLCSYFLNFLYFYSQLYIH